MAIRATAIALLAVAAAATTTTCTSHPSEAPAVPQRCGLAGPTWAYQEKSYQRAQGGGRTILPASGALPGRIRVWGMSVRIYGPQAAGRQHARDCARAAGSTPRRQLVEGRVGAGLHSKVAETATLEREVNLGTHAALAQGRPQAYGRASGPFTRYKHSHISPNGSSGSSLGCGNPRAGVQYVTIPV